MRRKFPQMPALLTPQIIEAIAQNAEPLKIVLNSGKEIAPEEDESWMYCCCPRVVTFKFVLCHVYITNENAACGEER